MRRRVYQPMDGGDVGYKREGEAESLLPRRAVAASESRSGKRLAYHLQQAYDAGMEDTKAAFCDFIGAQRRRKL